MFAIEVQRSSCEEVKSHSFTETSFFSTNLFASRRRAGERKVLQCARLHFYTSKVRQQNLYNRVRPLTNNRIGRWS